MKSSMKFNNELIVTLESISASDKFPEKIGKRKQASLERHSRRGQCIHVCLQIIRRADWQQSIVSLSSHVLFKERVQRSRVARMISVSINFLYTFLMWWEVAFTVDELEKMQRKQVVINTYRYLSRTVMAWLSILKCVAEVKSFLTHVGSKDSWPRKEEKDK